MNAHPVLLQRKYARIVRAFAEREGLTLDDALGLFYGSVTYRLMAEGVSDMHCMSDSWLVEELREELGR